MGRFASVLLAVSIVVTVCSLDGYVWQEHYGDGPPYYGRTTNMDKWADPLPFLLGANAATALLVGLTLRFRRSCQNSDCRRYP